MHRSILPACLGLLVLGACSVREDRIPCPCYLKVSFADPEAAGAVSLTGWNGENVFREQVRIEDCRPDWKRPVPKGTFVFSACTGIGNAVLDGHQVRIPAGCEADSLYAFARDVDATGEAAAVEVTLRKQFATVFLDIRKPAETVRSCGFQVDGDTCGFDLLDYAPVTGTFHFAPRPADGESIVSFRVPRQQEATLRVTIRPEDAPAASFPLGEYIRQLGYNWKSEELQDIYVAIDLARGRVGVRVEDWEEGLEFPIVTI